ncbi:hypothetical protein GOP47_0019557 [Adiantum capillus-veneris]|uniref:Uncharacterized protein n=1 Tax=Adiantum capillus-veneris TaxID=13818 RepID=A0A9D4UBQ5_ADICA|nr:hypothetical protein GOP47_0019557 [Adiantum capillus-veneris]
MRLSLWPSDTVLTKFYGRATRSLNVFAASGRILRKKHQLVQMNKQRTSMYVIQWVNTVALALSIVVLGLGVFLVTQHDNCEKMISTPILITGGFVMCISLIGYVGALREVSLLLWAYTLLVCLLLGAMAGFTLFTYIATHRGPGDHPKSVGAHDYKLHDYSGWLQNLLNDRDNWEHMKSCFVKPKYCEDMIFKFKNPQELKHATLSPLEAGCCTPPSECGYSPKNATFYILQSPPLSSHKDCMIYKNNIAIKCYNCDSCKGVIAHYLRKEWRIIALVNIVMFTMLIVLYSIAYCTRSVSLKKKVIS